MAAVCYTCYRPARTGYVRQSIALILALGAPRCVLVTVRVAVGSPASSPCLSPLSSPIFLLSTADYLRKYVLSPWSRYTRVLTNLGQI